MGAILNDMNFKTIIISIVFSIVIVVFIIFLNQKTPINHESGVENYISDGDVIYLNTALDVEYLGSESCQDCHKEIYNSFIQSQTGRSMSRMDTSNIIEDFPHK